MSRRGGYNSSSQRGRGGFSSAGAGASASSNATASIARSGLSTSNGQRFASSGSSSNASNVNRDGTSSSYTLNIGAAPRIQLPSDPSRRIIDYSSTDDKCPQCKTDRYLNPKLRLLVSPCYHKLCESCLDRIFSLGPAPCPECGKTCRKNQFGVQTFQDLQVEKEVDIRRRVGKLFNKREEDFANLNQYNDYLEEVESITFNLINEIDIEETERRISAFLNSNKALIQSNVRSAEAESESQRAKEKAEKAYRADRARRRRERQERDQREKEVDEMEMVEALAGRKGVDVREVMHRREENDRKRQERREREEQEDEEEDRRRELMMGSADAGRRRADGKKGDATRIPFHIEMLWDFEGPLATLDDSRLLYNLRPASTVLGGKVAKSTTSYDDPWITTQLERDDISKLRAGGYDWALTWQREIRSAVEGIGIVPIAE